MWRDRALMLVAGALGALALAPVGAVMLLPLALVLALRFAAATDSARHAAWIGLAFGVGYFGVSLSWIVEPMLVDIARHGWLAPPAIICMSLGAASFWALAFWAGRRLGGAVAIALTWVLAEAARALILTGFPWAGFAQSMMDTPMAWLLPWVGPRGVALVVLVAAALAARARGGAVLAAVAGAVLFVLPGPGGVAPADQAPIVRLIQPNAPQHQKWDPIYAPMFFDRLLTETGEGAGTDLIVWPEMALTEILSAAGDQLELVSDAAAGTPVILGVPRYGERGYHNSMIRLDQGAGIGAIYDKKHLVPFGEYMPFADAFARMGIYGLAAQGGYERGKTSPMVDIPGVGLIRGLICYEGVFAEEVRDMEHRPRALVLITNDAWFGELIGPYQHLTQARMRALELGLPMIRAANTGVSAMIDARGVVTAQIPLGQAGAIDVALPVALDPTPYARWGEWIFALMLVGVVAVARVTRTFR